MLDAIFVDKFCFNVIFLCINLVNNELNIFMDKNFLFLRLIYNSLIIYSVTLIKSYFVCLSISFWVNLCDNSGVYEDMLSKPLML